jgi:hypothetical protein
MWSVIPIIVHGRPPNAKGIRGENLLANNDIVKNVTPYFMVQSVRTNVLTRSLKIIICSDAGSCRLILNVVTLVLVEWLYVCN